VCAVRHPPSMVEIDPQGTGLGHVRDAARRRLPG
jgi:hypothetical protein